MSRTWSIEQIEAYKDKQADSLKGFAEADALLQRIPGSARYELEEVLGSLGRDYLAKQQERAPRDTGALQSELTIETVIDQLRVRIGLVGKPSKEKFVGRVIEYGRKAQTVIVQRRRAGSPKLLRRGRKRVEDIVSTYTLDVKARAPAPFVDVPDVDLDQIAANRTADFWSRTLGGAGA